MRYFKQIENNYIVSIGTGFGGIEISKDEYENILSIICNHSEENEEKIYKLTTELLWEELDNKED